MVLATKKGILLIIGGSEERSSRGRILKEYVDRAGGAKARIAVIDIAAEKTSEIGAKYTTVFRRLGAAKVRIVQVSHREEASSQHALKVIENATGIFFPGGNQLAMTALLGGTPMDRVVHDRFEEGIIIGGTSAGAAMMSDAIIIRGDAERAPFLGAIEMAPGLQLLLGVIIDTHFSQRGRYGRLIAAVAQYPHVLGIGIDENTAILVQGDEFTVIGEGAVTIIDASSVSYTNLPHLNKGDLLALNDLRLHILPESYQFDLNKRIPVSRETLLSRRNGRKHKNERTRNRLPALGSRQAAGPRLRT
jgi:cyanophycinase